MTKLIEIFELTSPQCKVEDSIRETIILIGENKPILLREVMHYCDDLRIFISNLTDLNYSPYHFTNGNHSVDFIRLMDYIETGKIKAILVHIRIIKSELISIMISNPSQNVSRLVSFWDNFDASLSQVIS